MIEVKTVSKKGLDSKRIELVIILASVGTNGVLNAQLPPLVSRYLKAAVSRVAE